jgi:site-specific DNA recombinase
MQRRNHLSLIQSKAVAYVRVSSKEQEEEGYSIPAQTKLLRSYASEQRIEIVREFADVESAKQSGRTNFIEMLAYLKKNPDCRIILVEKTDRLYRNFKDYVTIDELGSEVRLVKENSIISRDSRSSEKLMHGMKVLLAKHFIDNLREETSKGMTEKAEQGHWPSYAPLGYINNRETRLIEVDPHNAPLIKKLFESYATGKYSLKAMVQISADIGLIHPRSGTRLGKSETHRILHNPIYYGEFIWKGKTYQGQHKPIISRELFDSVQEVFKRSNQPRTCKRTFQYTGLLTCGICGCAMTAEIKKGRYVYYHCTGFKGKCGNTYIREDRLSKLLGEIISSIEISSDLAHQITNAVRESHKEIEEYRRKLIQKLHADYAAINAKLDKAYEEKLDGRIDDDLWGRISKKLQEELRQIRLSLSRFEQASKENYEVGISILELAKQASDIYLREDHKGRRKLLDMILSNCTFVRGILYPTYNKPFDILAQNSKNEDWRPQRDSNPCYRIESAVSWAG